MKEYIEREAAIKAFYIATADGDKADWCVGVVQSLPAADVREVVLCRDCKHNNACLTQAFVEDESKIPFDRNSFFCADGERSDNA